MSGTLPTRLLVVGGGRMGSALVAGLLDAQAFSAREITIVEVAPEARSALANRFADVAVEASPISAESAILAVKPADLAEACRALSGVGVGRVLSIVAGASLARLEELLAPNTPVVRAMPNTPALIRSGVSAIAAGSAAAATDLEWAETILGAVGQVVRLPEKLLDAVTGLSGSGPAYVFLVAEALIEAGVLAGLDRETARILANGTLLGSSRLLAESGLSAEQLRGEVTSPAGTTAAGLRILEQRGVRAAFLDAVAAAAARSKELGASS